MARLVVNQQRGEEDLWQTEADRGGVRRGGRTSWLRWQCLPSSGHLSAIFRKRAVPTSTLVLPVMLDTVLGITGGVWATDAARRDR